MAGDLDLDQAQFDACLDEGKYTDKVTADYQEGVGRSVSPGRRPFASTVRRCRGPSPLPPSSSRSSTFWLVAKPPSLEVAADSFRSLGQADAPVVVTEFSDYQ